MKASAAIRILALERARDRLKPELQTNWGRIARGSEFRHQAVGRQHEQAKRERRVAGPMTLISFVTAPQTLVDEFIG